MSDEQIDLTELVKENSELLQRRVGLCNEKAANAQKLTDIAAKIRPYAGRMPSNKFVPLWADRRELVDRNLALDAEMQAIKNRLREIADLRDLHRKSQKAEERSIAAKTDLDSQVLLNHLRALFALRKHYQDFAADATRVASMRQMAAEFVVRLNPVIESATGVGASA